MTMSEMKFIFGQVYTTLTKLFFDIVPSKIKTMHPKRKLHITPMFGNIVAQTQNQNNF